MCLATSTLQDAVAKLEARIKTLEVDDKKDAQTTQPEKVYVLIEICL